MHPYPGLEHNYYPIDEKLNSIGESVWDEVIMPFAHLNKNLNEVKNF